MKSQGGSHCISLAFAKAIADWGRSWPSSGLLPCRIFFWGYCHALSPVVQQVVFTLLFLCSKWWKLLNLEPEVKMITQCCFFWAGITGLGNRTEGARQVSAGSEQVNRSCSRLGSYAFVLQCHGFVVFLCLFWFFFCLTYFHQSPLLSLKQQEISEAETFC